jgi:hypothetical protein
MVAAWSMFALGCVRLFAAIASHSMSPRYSLPLFVVALGAAAWCLR